MAVPLAGAIAGASAYLDAKYHLRKDIASILEQRSVASLAKRQARQHKLSLYYLFEENALKYRNTPCIWHRTTPAAPAQRYTWTDTYHNVNKYSRFLLDLGLQPGQLVGMYLQNSPEFMFSMMGSWAVGSAPAMVNYHLAGDALVHSLKVADCKVLLVDEEEDCQQRLQEIKDHIDALGMRIITLNAETRAQITTYSPERLEDEYRRSITGASPIFLFYTSGTTGFPKACPLRTQAAYAFGQPRLRSTGLKPGDVWYDCMPLYHGTGGTVAVGCMISGVTLAIGRRFSVRHFWKDIHDSNAHAFVYVGETARYLLAAPPSPLDKGHKLKAMFGNGLRPDIWERFQDRFGVKNVNEFFNSTEGMLVLLNVCRGPFHVGHVGHHGAIRRRMLHDVIVPVKVDHETGDTIWRDPKTGFAKRNTYDEGGEIIIACKSENDFVGYWKNPEATGKRFERDVFRNGDLYYRTGDALRQDKDGRWFFLDRLGDTFRWKSENVSTAQVSECLGRFPGVIEANVYGVEVPGHDGRAGCAAVFIKSPSDPTGTSFDFAGLVQHLRKSLPRYAVPLFVRLIRQPTPMHNNKQNKMPLRREGVDPRKIASGDAGKEDVVLWLQPGRETYAPFTQREWDALVAGKVRL